MTNLIRKMFVTSLCLVAVAASYSDGTAAEREADARVRRAARPAKAQPRTQSEATTSSDQASSKSSTTTQSATTTPATIIIPEAVQSSPAAGEKIDWQVISSGGGSSSSASYKLSGTLGQTAVGLVSSVNHQLHQGFWQDFSASSSCCVGVVGNADGDPNEIVDLTDMQIIIDFIFFSGAVPACMDEADCASPPDGVLDLSDMQVVIDFMFFGGGLAACP